MAVWGLEDKGVLDVRCENITGKSFHASPPGASTVPKPVLKVSNILDSILVIFSLSYPCVVYQL